MLKLYHEHSIWKNWDRKYRIRKMIENIGRIGYEDYCRRRHKHLDRSRNVDKAMKLNSRKK